STFIELRSNHFVSILVYITVKVSVIVARILYANRGISVYKGIYLIVNGKPFNFQKLIIHQDPSTIFSYPYPAFGGTDRGLIGKGKRDVPACIQKSPIATFLGSHEFYIPDIA